MVGRRILFIPFAEHDDDFDRDRAIVQCGLEGISPVAERYTITVLKVNRFDFVWVELFDECNDLADLQHKMLFKSGMVKEEFTSIFKFRDKSFVKRVRKIQEFFRSIPRVQEDRVERDVGVFGFKDEVVGKLDFVFKVRILFSPTDL